MKSGFYLSLVILTILISSCKNTSFDAKMCGKTEYLHDAVKKTTDVIVHDIFSPVVAARIYAYSNIAAYEAFRFDNPKKYKSLAGQLNELTAVPEPPKDQPINFDIAGLEAYVNVSKALIFSESEMEDFRTELYAKLKADGVPDDVFEASKLYGKTVSDHILDWSKKDNYAQTRSFPKYTVTNEPYRWQPTPPAYIEGIEPSWRLIRPMVLDSSTQFIPVPPTAFSTDKNSLFYKQAMEVYKINDEEKENKTAIANFWDCNPYVMHQQGHLMFATKKVTPGGHWMGITALACRKAGLDMVATSEAYTLTSIGLFDGFIICWDEKYRSNLIRPESYINQYIDPEWLPTLQTPPFPEYTSGHSVISTASAVILSSLLGDQFEFNDSTEMEYGLPVRSFHSFLEASREAAISREYGGIHYSPAIDNGIIQGRQVGELILQRVKTSS